MIKSSIEWYHPSLVTTTNRKVVRKLLNVSNYPSSKWEDEQKGGWNIIIDIPFPEISPKAFTWEVEEQAKNLLREILKKVEPDDDVSVALQGEFTLCYILADLIRRWNEGPLGPVIRILIPTTEEKVMKKAQQDGSVKKTTVFKFVRWREL
jgi:hypothetical protein